MGLELLLRSDDSGRIRGTEIWRTGTPSSTPVTLENGLGPQTIKNPSLRSLQAVAIGCTSDLAPSLQRKWGDHLRGE